jgi:fluoride ion exporter CrcB/FEX
MYNSFIIVLGGGLGGLARGWASGFVAKRVGQNSLWSASLVSVSSSSKGM